MSSSPNNTILTLKHKIFFSISDFFLFNIDGLCLIQYHNSESKFKESKSKNLLKLIKLFSRSGFDSKNHYFIKFYSISQEFEIFFFL